MIHKYAIKFTPDIPDTSKLRGQIIKTIKEQLKSAFDFSICFFGNLYTQTLKKDDLELKTTHEEIEYTVDIQYAKSIEPSDMELFVFYAIFFKNCMRKLSFERIGRNFFNPLKAKQLTQYNLEVWPGFYTAL